MAFKDSFLSEFDQEMAKTRKTLERVPEERFAWKPHSKSMAMGSLASHLVNLVGFGGMIFDSSSFDIAPQGGE
ncbi:MAG: damage-inducible protein DinB, partial [Acidobacteriota bacterium]|nr:damage-inducible protein DinB [Acidobacteriota bacterium]